MITTSQPAKDPIYSDPMIKVSPSTGIHLDACIATPFRVNKGDAAEQAPSPVTILAPNTPPFNGCPEAVDGVAAVGMPPTLDGHVLNNFGDSRMVVDYYRYGAKKPWKSWEMFQPKQMGPNAFQCQTGCWHYWDKDEDGVSDMTQTLYTPGGGSGGGLSLAKYLLRAADLDSAIHPLLCTLPPSFFGLFDPARSVNWSYCCGVGTLPLAAVKAEGGQIGNAAWGVGATVYLTQRPLSPKLPPDVQWFMNAAMYAGIQLCDRDSAKRTPPVLAVIGEADPRIVALAKAMPALTLADFYVGPMVRYNYHTKVYPAKP